MSKKPVGNRKDAGAKSCGIVMPIAAWGDYDAQHWIEVREIIARAVKTAGMAPRPVWEGGETDIIQSRIVRNLYENAVIVCDISGLNPNVMFELGMRLTFRKPVVIIADETTRLPFDTNVIDTLSYPSDLHFSKIEQFMEDLAARITDLSTGAAGSAKPYLDTFGAFTVVVPQADRVEFDQYVIQKLDQIGSAVNRLQRDAILKEANERILAGGESQSLGSPSRWTQERLQALVDMWLEGRTASQIADELGNVSRNAVIGKAHRLGLPARPYIPPAEDAGSASE
jgi:hypothetical protein